MLYKFRSKATADLIMLPAHGQHILSILGKDKNSSRGILLPEEMAGAITRLEDAVRQEEAADQQAATQPVAHDAFAPTQEQRVTLRQRVAPFLDMVRRAQAAQVPVVWGN